MGHCRVRVAFWATRSVPVTCVECLASSLTLAPAWNTDLVTVQHGGKEPAGHFAQPNKEGRSLAYRCKP